MSVFTKFTASDLASREKKVSKSFFHYLYFLYLISDTTAIFSIIIAECFTQTFADNPTMILTLFFLHLTLTIWCLLLKFFAMMFSLPSLALILRGIIPLWESFLSFTEAVLLCLFLVYSNSALFFYSALTSWWKFVYIQAAHQLDGCSKHSN